MVDKTLRKRGGKWLRKLREDAGLTQRAVADKAGIKYYTFISQIENGGAEVPHHCLAGYAKALKVPPKQFVREYLRYYEPEVHRIVFGK